MELYSSEHARLDAEIAAEFGKSGKACTAPPGQGEEASSSSSSSGQQSQPTARGRSCAEQSSQGVGAQEE